MTDYLIGIDIGTGSVKALAIDMTGQLLDSAQVAYPTLHPSPHFSEQAPEVIWQAFVKCVLRLSSGRKAPAFVVLGAAMHSVIPCDEDGNALANMILWSDNRSAAVAEAIHDGADGPLLYEETGTPIHAMSPMCKLAWLRQNDAALFKKTAKFVSIKEYIWFRLFNEFVIDISIASATGLMDVSEMRWNKRAMDVAGVNETNLSRLVPTTYQQRNCRHGKMLGVDADTTFIAGASDGCLANLGSFAIENGVAALTIGTSGAIRVASQRPVPHFESMLFNYRLDEDTIICGGPTNNGGVALKWYIEKFLGKSVASAKDYADILDPVSRTPPGATGLIFLPYLDGERAPLWNSNACGTFFGIRSHHTQGDLTRAVLEGISMALYDIADHMVRRGLPIRKVHVGGGFIRSREWLQILANIFNAKMTLLNAEDASAMGACYLGLKVAGTVQDYRLLQPAPVKEIVPEPGIPDQYRDVFNRYRDLYAHLKDIMR